MPVLLLAILVPALTAAATDAPADSLPPAADSAVAPAADTAATVDSMAEGAQEDDFQQGVDSLFDRTQAGVDTAGWDNAHINAGRFESATWTDTARIALIDSATGKRYTHPFCGVVTSDFGQRSYLWHYGVDLRLRRGDSVRVAFDGTVRVIQYDRHGYGHVVVVRHANGLETIYGHLSKIFATPNQKVSAGEVIGLGGNSGHSTGPHLHFEMRYRGEPFDPNCIVDFAGTRLKSDTLVLTRADFEYLVELRKQKWCTVQPGDNLGYIARRYHSTVNKLCSLNHISGHTLLRIGRKLRYQ